MPAHRIFLIVATGCVSLLAGSAWAQSVVCSGTDRLSVHAEKVPLVQVLKELSEIVEIETLVIDPRVEQKPISLELEGVAADEAIDEILTAAGVNYTVWGGSGQPFRIFAGDPEGAIPSQGIELPPDEPESAAPPSPPVSSQPPPSPGADTTSGGSPPPVGVGGIGVVPPLAPPSPPQVEGAAGEAESPPPASPEAPAPPEPGDVTEGGYVEVPPSPEPQGGVTEGGYVEEPPPTEEDSLGEVPEQHSPTPAPKYPPFRPPGLPEPDSYATEDAWLATDSAVIDAPPTATQVASTVTILSLGLLLGVMLVSVTPAGNENRRPKGE